MSDRVWRRVAALGLLIGIGLAPVPVAAIGYQCLGADLGILDADLESTVVRIEFGPEADAFSYFVSFPVALPTRELPELWVLEVDDVPLAEPRRDVQTINALNPPARARDLWIWDFDARDARNFVRNVLEQTEAQSAVYEIRHPAPAQMRARVAEAQALARRGVPVETMSKDDPVGQALRAAVVNPLVADQILMGTQRRDFADPIVDVFALSPYWVRIEVRETGFHRIDYAQLRNALGADVDEIVPGSLRLFGARHRTQPELPEDPSGSWNAPAPLRERPLWIRGPQASTFGPSNEIIAYLPGASGWSDEFDPGAGLLDQDETVTADRIAYWLTWEVEGALPSDFDGDPLRMGQRDVSPGAATQVLRDARVRSHFEQNTATAFGLARDDWAWGERILAGSAELPGSGTRTFTVEGVVADSVAWFHMPLIGSRSGGSDVYRAEVSVNGVQLIDDSWTTREQESFITFDRPAVRSDGLALLDGSNVLRIVNRSSGGRIFVDAVSLTWRRVLEVGSEPLRWFLPVAEADGQTWRYEVRDDGGDLDAALVFERTDPWNPRRLVGAQVEDAGRLLRFDTGGVASTSRRFSVLVDRQLLAPLRLERRRPGLLRAELSDPGGAPVEGWDMVVLHPADFGDQAQDLVDLRRDVLDGRPSPRVKRVLLQDVYDQFGHGTKDPAAIRNYLKFLYEVDRDFTYALLVGDANRDARGVLPSSDEDFCPTFVQDYWPAGASGRYAATPFGRDEWLVCFDDRPTRSPTGYGYDLDLPDAALGRLPVTTPAEATRMVQRILDYELSPASGMWRNRVLLAADDQFGLGSGRTNEGEHVEEAECVAERVLPPALDVQKLYLTEYTPPTPSSVSKPGARADFREEWTEGALVVHYIGHGSPEQMADEILFRIEDVAALNNGTRLPLFLAFSCDVAIYDDPTTRSMSEQLVLQSGGGAIAAIAASEVTFSTQNDDLTEAFYTQMYPDADEPWNAAAILSRSRPIGLALMGAKWAAPGWQASTSTQNNNAKYVLLGDPALRLRSPEESVALSGDLAESFLSGREMHLEALFGETSGGSGTWFVEATESADSVSIPLPGRVDLEYVLDGAAFFRGSGSFDAGRLDLAVRAPASMRFGGQGRLRVLMEAGSEQYVGLVDSLDVVAVPVDSDDREGPSILLDFGQGARRVQPGSVLEATIEDASGINTLGTTPANSILYDIGDSGIATDVTDEFNLDEGSTTRGRVEVPLRDVDPGTYTLRMTASDMLGNATAAEISFEVVPGGRAEIGEHVPVPNPFRESTSFVVDVVSPAGLAADLDIDIRALDGSRVRTLRSRVEGGGGRAVVEWDGRDRRGDEIANGTYLYVVRVHFATEPPVTETRTGRVVLMR